MELLYLDHLKGKKTGANSWRQRFFKNIYLKCFLFRFKIEILISGGGQGQGGGGGGANVGNAQHHGRGNHHGGAAGHDGHGFKDMVY